MKLTDKQIKALKPQDKNYKVFDGGGLFLLIQTNGSKYWRLKYRYLNKEKLLSFGVYPEISLAEARQKREEAKRILNAGKDPSQVKIELIQAKEEALQNSFFNLAMEWHKEQSARWTEKHNKAILKSLETYIFPKISKQPIAEIKAPLILSVIRAIEAQDKKEVALRVLQRVTAIFNYAIQTGRAEDNPAMSLKGIVVKGEVKHMAALPQGELSNFYANVEQSTMRRENKIALLLLVLTFVRVGSLRFAEWSEIQFEKAEWHIPAEKMKKRKPLIVPLSDWAMELLAELKELTGSSSYLFPSERDSNKPISENTLGYAMNRLGYKGKATPHGFRSLATDVLNENNFDADIIERQMAHVEQNKVRAAYHRTEYLPQRKEMMEWYSKWLKNQHSFKINLIGQ